MFIVICKEILEESQMKNIQNLFNLNDWYKGNTFNYKNVSGSASRGFKLSTFSDSNILKEYYWQFLSQHHCSRNRL